MATPEFKPAGSTYVTLQADGKLDVVGVMNAMTAVKLLSEQTGLRSGIMRCVKCMKGEISWQVLGKKAHTSGNCSTPNCIVWIE